MTNSRRRSNDCSPADETDGDAASRISAFSAMAFWPARQLGQIGGPMGRGAQRALAAPARWALLSSLDAALSGLDAAVASPLAQEILDRIMASSLADDVLERLVGRVVDSQEAERAIERVIDSRLVDAGVLQLLDSDALWTLITEIVRSPVVTAAISQQGVGFAGQVAGVVRDRSRDADNRLERLARRLARRSSPAVGPTGNLPAT